MDLDAGRGADRALPEGMGMTALMIAQARATESSRPDRLIDDPLAREFVRAAGAAFQPQAPGLAGLLRLRGDYIAIRTRFFDDYLLDACRAGCRQIVLLAAGLDARAYRLAWPAEVNLFELDLPEVLAFKERVLATRTTPPGCRRVAVPADLAADWPAALRGSGFRPGRATAWLLEGILMYLAERERDQLLDRVGALSAPGSRLALDQRGVTRQEDGPRPGEPGQSNEHGEHRNSVRDANKDSDAEAARLGVRIPGAQPDASAADLGAWLNGHGWQARVFNAVERFRFYGRQVEQPVEEAAASLWLACAEPTSGIPPRPAAAHEPGARPGAR